MLNVVAIDEHRPFEPISVDMTWIRSRSTHHNAEGKADLKDNTRKKHTIREGGECTHRCQITELSLEGGDISHGLKLLVIFVLVVSRSMLTIRHVEDTRESYVRKLEESNSETGEVTS